MQAAELDDEGFFRTVAESGARALLIGRRALILLGAPVMTADYDLWVHVDDIERLNAAFLALDHVANHPAEIARQRGRYVIENGERVDVMVARSRATGAGEVLDFDSAWARRTELALKPGLSICVPSIADLIITKQWGARPKDLVDIQFLTALLRSNSG